MATLLDYIRKSPHRNWLERSLVRLLPGLNGNVLDIGSRNRRYDYLLKQKPVAIDIVEQVDRDVQKGDVTNLAFPEQSFDSVLCIEVLEYVDDPKRALAEIHRVLTPGGTLVLSVPFMFKVHEDRMRYTESYLRVLCGDFARVICMPVGNAYIAMLTIVWGKIKAVRFAPVRYVYTLLMLPFLLIAYMRNSSVSTNYPTGYVTCVYQITMTPIFRIDDIGASTKHFNQHGKKHVKLFGKIPFYFPFANVGFFKRVEPFRGWAVYDELTVNEWKDILMVFKEHSIVPIIAVTATWVERDGMLTPFPQKFPGEALLLKEALHRGEIMIANHGLTHCVVGKHLPRFWSSNRKYQREFLPELPKKHIANISCILKIFWNHILKDQLIFWYHRVIYGVSKHTRHFMEQISQRLCAIDTCAILMNQCTALISFRTPKTWPFFMTGN
jgi:SAM-dependent methyltransferase